jgi:hypothetical protein
MGNSFCFAFCTTGRDCYLGSILNGTPCKFQDLKDK